MDINFISIYSNTPSAKVLFVSDSVTDILGYQPEEICGKTGYNLTHPDERQTIKLIHFNNVKNQLMSSVTTYKMQHKDGYYINFDVVVHYCYDTLICTNFAVLDPDCEKRNTRTSSAESRYIIQEDGKYVLQDQEGNPIDIVDDQLNSECLLSGNYDLIAEQEPRFCLFVNRYTTQSTIVFATQMCELVGMNQLNCIGQSLYDYVSDEDKSTLTKHIGMSKSNHIITKLNLKWKKQNDLIPIEAVISCTYDGLVFVARLIPRSV